MYSQDFFYQCKIGKLLSDRVATIGYYFFANYNSEIDTVNSLLKPGAQIEVFVLFNVDYNYGFE